MTFAVDKRIIRAELKQKRLAMAPEERVKQSAEIGIAAKLYMERLQQHKQDRLLTICSYLAYRDEPDTFPLLNECWELGYRVLAPRIDTDQQGVFYLHRVHGIADIEPGAYGIPEPVLGLPLYTALEEIDLVIVPGLGYDRHGGRIGYGGGFYDRFIQQIIKRTSRLPIIAAFVFDTQLIPFIPMESHDFRVDVLFTPTGIITTAPPI